MRKIRTEMETLKGRLIGEQDVGLSCYHCLLRPVRNIVNAVGEPKFSHTRLLAQLRLLSEFEREVKPVFLLSGQSQR